jgi:hypothetical protein
MPKSYNEKLDVLCMVLSQQKDDKNKIYIYSLLKGEMCFWS